MKMDVPAASSSVSGKGNMEMHEDARRLESVCQRCRVAARGGTVVHRDSTRSERLGTSPDAILVRLALTKLRH